MVKILRKYNKYIMVVGGTLLMIAFLVPQAFNTLFADTGRRTYATLKDGKITLAEHEKLQREYSALEAFSPGLMKGELRCESLDHWILLAREAREAGVVGEDGDGGTWTELNTAMEQVLAAQIARNTYGAQAEQKLADPAIQKQCLDVAKVRVERQKTEAAAMFRLTPVEFNRAMSEARGAYRLRNTFRTAPRLSDRRATSMKAERFEGAVIEGLVIPAERIASSMPEPGAEELAAHFARYREAKPGSGDMGFGYLLDARVKLEWLTLDRAVIEKAVPTDAVEANKRWRSNRAKYPGEFAAEQARVETDIKKERVAKIASDADLVVRQELRRAAGKLEAEGPYKKLPADWAARRPKLEDVAQAVVKAVKESSGVDIPLPTVTVKNAGWLTESELYALPGVGAASVSLGGGRSVSLPEAIFSAREFGRTDAPEQSVGLQVGLTSAEVVGVDETSRYYFTILDYRKESPADSLDEVRERCVLDMKKLRAFEKLKESLPAYEVLAAGGLGEVKKTVDAEYPLPPEPPEGAGPGTARPQPLQVNEREFVPLFAGSRDDSPTASAEFREKIRAIASSMDPTKPATAKPAEERVASAVVPRALAVRLGLVVGVQPATFEVLRAMGEDRLIQMQLRDVEGRIEMDANLDPYRFEAMKSRWSYAPQAIDTSAPFHIPSPKKN